MKKLYVAGSIWVVGHYHFDDFVINANVDNVEKLKQSEIDMIKCIILNSYGKKLVAIFNIMELAE